MWYPKVYLNYRASDFRIITNITLEVDYPEDITDPIEAMNWGFDYARKNPREGLILESVSVKAPRGIWID